jgi:basic membrane protein A
MYKNLAAAFAAALLSLPAATQTPEPLKVGFVYVAPITEAGWVRQHEEGRKAVQAALGKSVATSFVENVPEGADAELRVHGAHPQGGARVPRREV